MCGFFLHISQVIHFLYVSIDVLICEPYIQYEDNLIYDSEILVVIYEFPVSSGADTTRDVISYSCPGYKPTYITNNINKTVWIDTFYALRHNVNLVFTHVHTHTHTYEHTHTHLSIHAHKHGKCIFTD